MQKLTGELVVGTRRLKKAIEAGNVTIAYLALDADLFITNAIRELCRTHAVRLIEVNSMRELGEACAVDVPTASAGVLR